MTCSIHRKLWWTRETHKKNEWCGAKIQAYTQYQFVANGIFVTSNRVKQERRDSANIIRNVCVLSSQHLKSNALRLMHSSFRHIPFIILLHSYFPHFAPSTMIFEIWAAFFCSCSRVAAFRSIGFSDILTIAHTNRSVYLMKTHKPTRKQDRKNALAHTS